MVLWVGIGAGTIFLRFRFFDHGVVKFDHVVVPSQKKPFAVPKSHKGTIYVLWEPMVLFHVACMGSKHVWTPQWRKIAIASLNSVA